MNKKHPNQANRESHLLLNTALFVIWLLFAGLAVMTYLEKSYRQKKALL